MADSLSIHWVFSQLGSQKGASVRVRTCYLPAWPPLFALRPKLLQFLQRVPKGKFSHRVVLTLFLIAIQMPNIVFSIFLRNFFRIENFKHKWILMYSSFSFNHLFLHSQSCYISAPSSSSSSSPAEVFWSKSQMLFIDISLYTAKC